LPSADAAAPPPSAWWATLGEPPPVRPVLDGDRDVDVAVVGAGFTGLWCALGLVRRDPSLRVVVLEAAVAGFGASGRNGGWASALYPVAFDRVARAHGREAVAALRAALRDGVVDLEADAAAEGISFDYRRGGTVTLARAAPQVDRLRAELAALHELGDTDDDVRWLEADAARTRCDASGTLGALYTPHCAAIHPAKLAVGLAAACERRGVTVHESTPVTAIQPGTSWRRPWAVTPHGTVRADVVVRATEGYTPRLRDARRAIAPLYSLIIATEPLPEAFYDRIGLAQRETFCDGRHLIIYGQRTADDRLVFGGRGAPYHLGSRTDPRFDDEPAVFRRLHATLEELFGTVPGAITHRWGGPLGVARDLAPYARFDATTGLAAAGGYVGDGVVLSRLAGLAVADLVQGAATSHTVLPFVGHRSREWEPEPLRWLGINGGLLAAAWADRAEARTGRPSRAAGVLDRLLGR
jgi:glycine/D-amino acid oxidase-like deaminating enzyme